MRSCPVVYRGASLTRKRTPLGPYRRPMPRIHGGSSEGGRFLMGKAFLHSSMGEVPLYSSLSSDGVRHKRGLSGAAFDPSPRIQPINLKVPQIQPINPTALFAGAKKNVRQRPPWWNRKRRRLGYGGRRSPQIHPSYLAYPEYTRAI